MDTKLPIEKKKIKEKDIMAFATANLLITNQLLYQLSYEGLSFIYCKIKKKAN